MQFYFLAISSLVASALAAPAWSNQTIVEKRAVTISDLPGDNDMVNCGGKEFNNFQIEDAAQAGVAKGIQSKGYPHTYGNSDKLSFPNCASGTLVLFPVLSNGKKYTSGKPEAYRVVYQETTSKKAGKYCGMMYHPPGDESGFDKCT